MTDATEADDFPHGHPEIDPKPTEADEEVTDTIKDVLGDGLFNAFREGMDTGVYTNVMGMLVLCEIGADIEEIKRNLLDMKEFLEPDIAPNVVAALTEAYADAVKDNK